MHLNSGKKVVAIIIVLFLVYLAFLVLEPIISAIAWGTVFAYIFYPLYLSLNKRIKNERVSAMIVTIGIIVVAILTLGLLVTVISKELVTTYSYLSKAIAQYSTEEVCTTPMFICNAIDFLNEQRIKTNTYFEQSLNRLAALTFEQTSIVALALPGLIFNLFIILFVIYYLLIDGNKLVEKIRLSLPWRKGYNEMIIRKIADVSSGVVFGYLVTGILITAVSATGYYLFGLRSPILLGILTGLTSVLPAISTWVIWLPAGLIVFSIGLYNSSNVQMLKGLGVLAFGMIVLSGILDNILKTKLIGGKANVHPVVILLGAIGGIVTFGLVGVFLGPLILTIIGTILFEGPNSSV